MIKKIKFWSRRTGQNRFLWGLFIFAVIFRLLLMVQFRFAVSFDEAHYLRLSASIFERGLSGLLHPYWTPFYPGVIAFTRLMTVDPELAGRLINVLSGSLLVLLIYRLSRELFGKKEAFFAGLLVSIYPPLAYMNTNVMPETLYTLTGISGLYLGWKSIQKMRPDRGLLAGLFWGMTYLLKPEGAGFLLVYIVIGGIFFSYQIVVRRERKCVLIPMLTIIGFLLVASPYFLYLRKVTGEWTLSAKAGVNQQLEAAEMFDMGDVKDPLYHLTADNRFLPYDMAYHIGNIQELKTLREGKQRVVHIPVRNYIQKYSRNLYHVLKYNIPHLMTTVLLVLWAIGFFGEWYDQRSWKLIFYLLANVAFFWFLLVPLFHVNDRYLMPLFPLCFIWVGKGCIHLYHWIVRGLEGETMSGSRVFRHRYHIGRGLVIGILLLNLLPEMGKILAIHKYDRGQWAEPVEMKEAGLWLKENTEHPPILMSLNKAVDFYAGQNNIRRGASFSYDLLPRNLAYARYREVEYLVFSDRYLDWFPNLKPLMESRDPSPELQLMHEQIDPAGTRTVIYRLLPEEYHRPEDD